MENHQFQCVNPLQMTIFNSHVKLPEGIWFMNPWFPQLTLFTPEISPPKPSWRCRQCPSSCRSLVGIYLRGVPSMGIPKSWMVYNGKAYEKPMKSLWEWMVSQGTRIHGSLFFWWNCVSDPACDEINSFPMYFGHGPKWQSVVWNDSAGPNLGSHHLSFWLI